MLSTDPVLAVVLVAIFLLVAYPVHEFSHAWAAYMQGDATAKQLGRLTLNPIVHFDPFGGLLLAISALSGSGLLFGWAKPTPVNPNNLRDRRNGDLIVAIAGPVSNLVMAVIGAFVIRLGLAFDLWQSAPYMVGAALYYFVAFNVLLAIFNLIPVPQLDGSAILFRLLPPEQAWRLRPMLAQYGFIILIGVFLLGGRYLGDVIFGVTNFLVGA